MDAMKWYERALKNLEAGSNSLEFDSTMGNPPYQIRATMAKLYFEGGHGLAKDPSKAGNCDYIDMWSMSLLLKFKGNTLQQFWCIGKIFVFT